MFDRILASKAKRISIIAAPGSGKTKRGIIPKVQQVLEDTSINPADVLLLTFSRLSAKDLKERVSTLERAPRASTVHSLCLAFLLSENSHDMRKRVESILLDFEQNALISDLKLLFPRKPKPKLKEMLKAFSAGWAVQPHDTVFEEDDDRRAFKAAVVNWLSEHEAVMMDEIVYGAVDLARKIGATDFIRNPQHIFVDEYQDLNKLEQEFIELLAAESKLLFVVGDPDQSIYSFKYAYPEGIKGYATSTGVEPYSSLKTGRCPKQIVEIANQLLLQTEPTRTNLLESVNKEDGEVHFVQKNTQKGEFDYVLNAVAGRLKAGAKAKDVIILVPKKPLGAMFVEYAESQKDAVGVPSGINFKFDSKIKLTDSEEERILLFGLLSRSNSLLHLRGYLGLRDDSANAGEIRLLKNKYGDLASVLLSANPDDFRPAQRRARALCQRVIELRAFLESHKNAEDVEVVLDELFPKDSEDTTAIRKVCDELREDDDTLTSLYSKLIDHLRTIPVSDNDVRVMTLMGSKGLEAPHVFILGSNDGNIPGKNRSSYLTDMQHKEEQRRLLFVGVTRASKTLTISWARHIPFGQSRQHHTAGLRTIRPVGFAAQTVVALSEFLQDLNDITWET